MSTVKSKEAVGVNTRKAQYPPPPRISWLLEKHFLPNFLNLTTITLHFALVPCEVSKTLLLVGWSQNQAYLKMDFQADTCEGNTLSFSLLLKVSGQWDETCIMELFAVCHCLIEGLSETRLGLVGRSSLMFYFRKLCVMHKT